MVPVNDLLLRVDNPAWVVAAAVAAEIAVVEVECAAAVAVVEDVVAAVVDTVSQELNSR
jgi:hypothetical protein